MSYRGHLATASVRSPTNRRPYLAATGSSLVGVLVGCLQSGSDEDGTDSEVDESSSSSNDDDGDGNGGSDEAGDAAENRTEDAFSEPNAVLWVAEIRDEPPAATKTGYSADADELDGFEPLAELLETIDAEDDVSAGDRFHSEQVRYEGDRRSTLEAEWDDIDADSDGEVVVEYDSEDVYFDLTLLEEFAD